jgi:hypothetical protein
MCQNVGAQVGNGDAMLRSCSRITADLIHRMRIVPLQVHQCAVEEEWSKSSKGTLRASTWAAIRAANDGLLDRRNTPAVLGTCKRNTAEGYKKVFRMPGSAAIPCGLGGIQNQSLVNVCAPAGIIEIKILQSREVLDGIVHKPINARQQNGRNRTNGDRTISPVCKWLWRSWNGGSVTLSSVNSLALVISAFGWSNCTSRFVVFFLFE